MSMHFPPATPLAVILFIALAFLVISTISTPVVKQIPLAIVNNVHFGVLGYCYDNGECSKYQIGYDTNKFFNSEVDSGQFSLPLHVRHRLSSLLIVHPIAAFLTLVDFLLALAAHFHSPSHSPRYLLAMIILIFPTLLVTLLAFLVDILVFVPNMRWGSWIVLASTILLCISWVVTCSMRRMLVSRRATQKRLDQHLVEGNQSVAAASAVNAQQAQAEAAFKEVAVNATGVENDHSFGIRRGDSVISDQNALLPMATNDASGAPPNLQPIGSYNSYANGTSNAINGGYDQNPARYEGLGYLANPPEPWDNRRYESYPMDTFGDAGGINEYGSAARYYSSPRAMSPAYNQSTPPPRVTSPMGMQGAGRGGPGGYMARSPSVPSSSGSRGMPLPPGAAGSGGKRTPSVGGRTSRNGGSVNDYPRNSPGPAPGMMRQPTLPQVDHSASPVSPYRQRRTNSGNINFSRPASPSRVQRQRNPHFSTSPAASPAPNYQQQTMAMGGTPMINVDSSNTSGHEHVDSFHAVNDPGYSNYYEDVEPRFASEAEMDLPRNLQPGSPSGEFTSNVTDTPEKLNTLETLDTPDHSAGDNAPDDADGVLPFLEHYKDDNDGDECGHARGDVHFQENETVEVQPDTNAGAISRSASNAQETGTLLARRPAESQSLNITDSTDTNATTASGIEITSASAATMNTGMSMVTSSFSTPEFPPYPPPHHYGPAPIPPVHRQSATGLMHVRPVKSFALPRVHSPTPNDEESKHQRWASSGIYSESSRLPPQGHLPQSFSYGSMPYHPHTGYLGPGHGHGYRRGSLTMSPPPLDSPPSQAQDFPPLSPPPLPSPGYGYNFPPPSPSFDQLERCRTVYSHSPSPSLSSHFTSISQREINPRWRPEYDNQPQYLHLPPYNNNNNHNHNRAPANSRPGAMSPRDQLRWRLEQQQQIQQGIQSRGKRDRLDVLLEGNPDFELVVGKEARQREAKRGGLLSQRVPADKEVLCGTGGMGRVK